MSRCHGADVRVYLGARDASGDAIGLTLVAKANAHEVTNFASGNWVEHDPGLKSWEAAIEAFYDPAAGGIARQLETLLGSNTSGLGVLSVYDGDADAIGDSGFLGGEAVFEKRDDPKNVNEVMRLNGSLKGNGRLGLLAKLLHPKGADGASYNGASLDNAASSAFGGRGNLHITTISGTWTIKVQHAPDNSTWADLIAFTQATAITSQSVEVTGTVDRYLRVISTEDAPGTCEFVAGFARYTN